MIIDVLVLNDFIFFLVKLNLLVFQKGKYNMFVTFYRVISIIIFIVFSKGSGIIYRVYCFSIIVNKVLSAFFKNRFEISFLIFIKLGGLKGKFIGFVFLERKIIFRKILDVVFRDILLFFIGGSFFFFFMVIQVVFYIRFFLVIV